MKVACLLMIVILLSLFVIDISKFIIVGNLYCFVFFNLFADFEDVAVEAGV